MSAIAPAKRTPSMTSAVDRKRTGDDENLFRFESFGEGLLDLAAHVGLAHQIFGGPAGGEILHRAQFYTVGTRCVPIGVFTTELFEMTFPVGFVVRLARQPGD